MASWKRILPKEIHLNLLGFVKNMKSIHQYSNAFKDLPEKKLMKDIKSIGNNSNF